MEKRGVPTVMICTDEFHQLGREEAGSLGMPTLPIALVPHPLGGQQPEHIQTKADKALEQVVEMLTTPATRLMQEVLSTL
jgi:hypothetical protein